MGQKKSPALAQVMQSLVLLRLFLPLAALGVIAISGVGYIGEQTLETQQHQIVQSMARIVDRYLDQATRALDAVARVAEVSLPEDLANFMQGAWKAYGYFDTLYYLDASSKIMLVVPPDSRYLGLDMSNLPYFQQTGEKKNLIISRPFISLRTGNPTVYLVRQLSQGGKVVGELGLGSLQDEITRGRGAPNQDVIFIMDQSGMLLAHPSFNLVKQQTNQSHLEIFHRGLGGDATLIYEYAGTMVLGSATRVERTGWVVVDQVPLSAALGSYEWALGLILLASLAIWLALAWNLRGQLQRHVVTPLVQLGRGTSALANGDFSRGKALASIPAAFAELTSLATDFQHMSDALETRQAKLQESETRFRTFVEKANDIIYSISLDGIFTYASPNWKELLGHEVNEVVGQSFEPFVHPDDLASCRAILKRVVVNGEKVSGFEYRVQHKNGIWYWHSSNASAIYDAGGRIVSFLGIARNITERKHAEEEIKKLNAELEQRVADRTAQLEAANKELDAFAYSVSHDLRAPLRHIDGFLDLLKNRLPNLDEKSLHYMTNISSSATRMGTLIDDLLSFSRMGRQEMSNTRVDLASLVREVIRELEPDAQNRSIHWHIADLPTVTGDRAMLRVVLVNFLSNALKFTQLRQQAEIEIGCQSQETETIIFVRDNGVGFDPRYADKLFGVFQRLHRADEFEGTGIGLANVQRIINRHGGRIWAEGAVNQGATFYFSLPMLG